jgi:DHA2 family multidrug resistance protein-like MFS transporter
MAAMGVTLVMPFRLQQQYGFSPAQAGACIAPWPLMILFVAPVAGLLSDRMPAGLLGGLGMAVATCGISSLAFLPDAPHYLDVAWRIAICGTGFGMFYPSNARQIVGAAPMDRTAAAGGLTSTISGAGRTLGSTMVAALIGIGAGLGPTAAYISASLCMISGLFSLSVLGVTVRGRRAQRLP